MFLCDACHGSDGCTLMHLARSRGRCESCRLASDCVDCLGERVELAPVTVEEIRTNLLCHLVELARMIQSCGAAGARELGPQLDCARHMCRLAGISELEIVKADEILAKPAPPVRAVARQEWASNR